MWLLDQYVLNVSGTVMQPTFFFKCNKRLVAQRGGDPIVSKWTRIAFCQPNHDRDYVCAWCVCACMCVCLFLCVHSYPHCVHGSFGTGLCRWLIVIATNYRVGKVTVFKSLSRICQGICQVL